MASEVLLVEARAAETVVVGKPPNTRPVTTLKDFDVRVLGDVGSSACMLRSFSVSPDMT